MELPTNFWDGPFVNCVAVVVELLSGAQLCNPWTVAFHSSLSFTNLLEFAQTHVCCVTDIIQPSHPLSHPSSPALSLS